MSLTYTSYLKVEELTQLQQLSGPEPEHDEMLFIVIHQVYELWFKQVLHEIDFMQQCLDQSRMPQVAHTMKRLLKIMKTMVSQLDILETMSPLQFRSFRDRLETASGFQSYQFREFEFVLGKKDTKVFDRYPEGAVGRMNLVRRYEQPSLWQSFLSCLSHQGFSIPAALIEDTTQPTQTSKEVQSVLIQVYRQHPELAALCESLVDLDEGIQEWRYRHVKMVERTIGSKSGTGGSAGAQYLISTLFKPLFPDLWAIRAAL